MLKHDKPAVRGCVKQLLDSPFREQCSATSEKCSLGNKTNEIAKPQIYSYISCHVMSCLHLISFHFLIYTEFYKVILIKMERLKKNLH